MGYSGFDDLIGDNKSREKFREAFKVHNIDFDLTLACRQFPSISLGSFPSVELYDGPSYYPQNTESLVPQILEGCIPSRIDANWVDYILEEKIDKSTMYSQSSDWNAEPRNASQLMVDIPCSNSGSETQLTAASVAEILDRCINCIPGMSKRQFGLLENSGFHTVCCLENYLGLDAFCFRCQS